MSFDTKSFVDDFGIESRPSGRDWFQVPCPFCDDHFPWHMGINHKDDYFNCFICHRNGNISFLIYHLLKTTYSRAKEIAEQYGAIQGLESDPGPRAERVDIAGLVPLQPIHIQYLEQRKFDHIQLERKYQIKGCYTLGRFPYRIVIPIYDDRVLVNATARDVTGQQKERYMTLHNEEAVIPAKESVYNIDSIIGDNILIVEGPFDVWRIGGNTVCLFGTAFKMAQVMRILSKIPRNIYIMFDKEEEAQKHANKLAACFAPFVNKVEVLEIPAKDPAMLSAEQALDVRNELGI